MNTITTPSTKVSKIPLDKDICNAFGCSNKDSEKIYVDAGIFGTVTLEVCQFCINKFQNKGDLKTENEFQECFVLSNICWCGGHDKEFIIGKVN